MTLTTPVPNQKTKNSSSEKRGSIDKLASSIAADESAASGSTSNAAAVSMLQAYSAQMQMQMQMQNNPFNNQMANSNRMMKAVMKQLKKQKKKNKKKRSRRGLNLESTPSIAGNSKKIAVAIVVVVAVAVAAAQDTAPMDKFIGFKNLCSLNFSLYNYSIIILILIIKVEPLDTIIARKVDIPFILRVKNSCNLI